MNDLLNVTVTVNSTQYTRAVEPRLLLSDFVRHELGLTGTHVGCEHGVCGACTVLFDGEPVRSCLMFAVQANGHEILTVEGLGSQDCPVVGPGEEIIRHERCFAAATGKVHNKRRHCQSGRVASERFHDLDTLAYRSPKM